MDARSGRRLLRNTPSFKNDIMNATAEPTHTMNVRALLIALRAVRKGEFGVRLPSDETGIDGAVAEAFNDIVELLESSNAEFVRISTVVGKEGRITQRASLPGATSGWATRVESVNSLIADLVSPT